MWFLNKFLFTMKQQKKESNIDWHNIQIGHMITLVNLVYVRVLMKRQYINIVVRYLNRYILLKFASSDYFKLRSIEF